MHKQNPFLISNANNLSQTLNQNTQSLNINSSTSQLEFTIKRKRSLTSLNPNKTQSLQRINKTPSPKHVNKQSSLTSSLTLKDNNYFKPNLLHQKFHQLTLNPTQKKPLKLKISKLNNQQPNHLIKQHFNDFSKELESKFQKQNKIIENSLQKIQKFVIKNVQKNKQIQTNQQILVKNNIQDHLSQNKLKNLQKQLEKQHENQLGKQGRIQKQSSIFIKQEDNQQDSRNKYEQLMNEKQRLENRIQELIVENQEINEKIKGLSQQKQKLMQENKELKTINSFLVSENYKLSIQISLLKDKILEYEHKEYQDININDSSIVKSQSLKQQLQISNPNSTQLLKQSKYESNKEVFKERNEEISRKDVLIKQIKTQNFSLMNKHIEDNDDQDIYTITQMKSYKNLLNSNIQIDETLQKQITKLSQKISQLQQELLQQKNVNQNLSNRLAVLKLQQHGVKRQSKRYHKKNQSLDSVVSIKINLQSQDPSQNSQCNSQHLKKTASFHQSIQKIKKSQPSIENIPHKVSKSKILSNQFIYFAQNLQNQKQSHVTSIDPKQPDYQKQTDMNQTKRQQTNFLGTIKQQDEDEKKKTICMKKLQIPAEQIRKRRKSISQQLNVSLQKKGNPKRRVNNSLSFYSKQKIAQLQILKQTITLKFQAFKYTFELFQSQMILWPNRTATTKDLKSILSEYPFLLQESAIDILLSYCDALDADGIAVDIFCNKMREFIAEYTEMTEEQELILEKKILKRWKYTSQEILELMRKCETVVGEITKEAFLSVLEEFKFEENEIHHLLSQSVAISPDLNRIKYRHYLQNFLAKN